MRKSEQETLKIGDMLILEKTTDPTLQRYIGQHCDVIQTGERLDGTWRADIQVKFNDKLETVLPYTYFSICGHPLSAVAQAARKGRGFGRTHRMGRMQSKEPAVQTIPRALPQAVDLTSYHCNLDCHQLYIGHHTAGCAWQCQNLIKKDEALSWVK